MAGGGEVVPVSPSGGGRGRGNRQIAAWLPLDIIVSEIAARSDPATLVRCAATCRDARRRIAEISDEDPDLRSSRLRLRDTDRFVLPLLRGHLTRIMTYASGGPLVLRSDVYVVDAAAAATAAAESSRLLKITFASGADDAETLHDVAPVDSRRGLVLVRATAKTGQNPNSYQSQLFVWNPATRRRLVLPPEPAFFPDGDAAGSSTDVQYVLIAGDNDGTAAIGRHFHVVKAKLVLSEKYRCQRRLLVQTFSSEHGGGAWSPCTEISTPNLHGIGSSLSLSSSPLQRRPLVVGDVVHWLCLTDAGSYMLALHVRAAAVARVSVTALPASFPREDDGDELYYHHYPHMRSYHYLLVSATAGGNPVVLVADKDRISAWEQSKHTKKWKTRPQVVIENDSISIRRFMREKCVPRLEMFGERSGAVLLRIRDTSLLWLDLHTKKIIRSFTMNRLLHAEVFCPHEMDLSSWVPSFDSDLISFD